MKKASLIIGLIIAACTAKKVITITESDVERAEKKFPGITMQDLEQGKNLYQNNCNLCHRLEKPQNFTENEWRKIVPSMVKKANKKGASLTEKDEDLILKYVLTYSK